MPRSEPALPAPAFLRVTRGSALVLALTVGCVFVPPPPLPGEEGFEPSGLGSSTPTSEGGGAVTPAQPVRSFRKGEEARPGMTLAEIEAFNAAAAAGRLGQRHVVVHAHEHALALDREVGERLDPGGQAHSFPATNFARSSMRCE